MRTATASRPAPPPGSIAATRGEVSGKNRAIYLQVSRQVLRVLEPGIGLHQLHQRVGHHLGPRPGRDHVPQGQDRGIVRLEPVVEQRRPVLLFGELFLQSVDPQLPRAAAPRALVALLHLAVRGERRLTVGRIQLRLLARAPRTRRPRAAARRPRANQSRPRRPPGGTRAPPGAGCPARRGSSPIMKCPSGRRGSS